MAAVSTVTRRGNVQGGKVEKVYERPVIRDYGDLRDLTAVIVVGTADDGVIKSSDVGVIKQ
ncbi:MAG: lasso RiPP family leader peptide-containing protein [Actinomycetota bacterium]|nr:lasso RiPP family leader peptide-containing protein [Actinomycetota bacterium]